MKRKYLALLLAAVTAVSQTAGTATVGASSIISIVTCGDVRTDSVGHIVDGHSLEPQHLFSGR